jgi:hypothetical protein
MRASNRIVGGCFRGGEIEPGTFHKTLLGSSDRVSRHPDQVQPPLPPPQMGSASAPNPSATTGLTLDQEVTAGLR